MQRIAFTIGAVLLSMSVINAFAESNVQSVRNTSNRVINARCFVHCLSASFCYLFQFFCIFRQIGCVTPRIQKVIPITVK